MAVTGKEHTVTVIMCSVEIARQPGEVFSYVTDPAHFGEWQAGVVDGHIEPAGPVQVGSRCVMTRRLGGADRTSTSEVTEELPEPEAPDGKRDGQRAGALIHPFSTRAACGMHTRRRS